MRALALPVLLASVMALQPASAQNARPPAPNATRHFFFEEGLMDDLKVDGILTEAGQGTRGASASLDVCFPSAAGGDKVDRVVVPLASERGRLVGQGKSQVDGEQVAVNMTRRQTGGSFAFEGSIKIGSDQLKVSATEVAERSENDLREKMAEGARIAASPPDFADVSPDTVGFRVKRDALPDLLKRLRGQDALIDRFGLGADCRVLRTGEHVLLVQVHPERAAALIEKAKGLPGLLEAGYGTGNYSLSSAVRIPDADFRKDGRIDYDRVASVVGVAAEKAFSARLKASAWNPTTGELALELTRASDLVPGSQLLTVMRMKVLATPDTVGPSKFLVIWVGNTGSETVDGDQSSPLRFITVPGNGNEGSNESGLLVRKLAEDLKGRTWDDEGSAWK